jgi:predicted PurR-regulated permease PerM
MTPRPPSQDITRITLAVLFIGLMIFASLWVLWPFMAATVWAIMIVVGTWPMMRGQIETAVRRLGEDLGIDRVVDAR